MEQYLQACRCRFDNVLYTSTLIGKKVKVTQVYLLTYSNTGSRYKIAS